MSDKAEAKKLNKLQNQMYGLIAGNYEVDLALAALTMALAKTLLNTKTDENDLVDAYSYIHERLPDLVHEALDMISGEQARWGNERNN